MNIKVDIRKQVLIVDDVHHSLAKFEDFILRNWTPLADANKIGRVISGKTLKTTYDWNKIFQIAIEGGVIILEFLDKNDGFKKKPANDSPFAQGSLFN